MIDGSGGCNTSTISKQLRRSWLSVMRSTDAGSAGPLRRASRLAVNHSVHRRGAGGAGANLERRTSNMEVLSTRSLRSTRCSTFDVGRSTRAPSRSPPRLTRGLEARATLQIHHGLHQRFDEIEIAPHRRFVHAEIS